MPSNVIVLKNIRKTYRLKSGNAPVLNVPYATIPLDGMVVIVGWSGSGKSTLLNIISVIDHPDPATDDLIPTIEYHLSDVVYSISYPKGTEPVIEQITDAQTITMSESRFRREVFGYVFQEHYLHPNLNVRYNIKMPLFTRGKTVVDTHLQDNCEPFGIHTELDKQANEISGGQAQRSAIVRGLMKRTPIVFGDELTSNIDQKLARQILDGVETALAEEDSGLQSFLWVSHDINLVKDYAKHIVTIKKGEISVHENGYKDDAEGILALLHEEDAEPAQAQARQLQSLEERNAGAVDYLKYFWSYAYHDLFRKNGLPTIDFAVIAGSLVLVILFLFTILKISYGSTRFMELKLSDPRINSVEVVATEKIGALAVEDYEFLAEELGDQIRYITPSYFVNTSLQNKENGRFRNFGLTMTFREDDPIVHELLDGHTAPFVTGEDYQGLIIHKDLLTRFGYEAEAEAAVASFNNNHGEEQLPVLGVTVPLPQGSRSMMREQYYLTNFERFSNEERPSLGCITIYPKDIYQTEKLREIIEANGKYEVRDALKIKNKIQLIDEIKRQFALFVQLSLLAIVVLSIMFVGVTIYRSLHKKRKEIGVFMAYGMSKGTLFLFYLCETAIIATTTLAVSLGIYVGIIEPMINQVLVRNGLLTITGTEDFGTQIDTAMLQIPYTWMGITYGAILFLLVGLFSAFIYRFSTKKPIKLMRDI